jgi:hypothetical protein
LKHGGTLCSIEYDAPPVRHTDELNGMAPVSRGRLQAIRLAGIA